MVLGELPLTGGFIRGDQAAWVGEAGCTLKVDISPVDQVRNLRKAAAHVPVSVI